MKKLIIFLIFPILVNAQQVNQDYNLKLAVGEIDQFWQNVFAQNNQYYQSPSVKVFNSQYPVNTSCGSFRDMNCFYCSLDNSVSMSTDLINYLKGKGYSNSILFFIVAHEYGHAVQKQLNKFDALSVDKELQADCLSGVFFNKVAQQNRLDKYDVPHVFHWMDSYQENGKLLKTLFDPQSHGNPRMRKEAFYTGLKNGDINGCFQKHNVNGAIDGILSGIESLFNKN